MFDHAFIFGQDPDKMRGGFEKFQSFIGDLTGLNLWNYLQNDSKIMDMALCIDWEGGNVLAWEKTNIKTQNVSMEGLENARELCIEDIRFVIFPESVTQNPRCIFVVPGSAQHQSRETPLSWQFNDPSQIIYSRSIPSSSSLLPLGLMFSTWHFSMLAMRSLSP